MAFGKLAKNYDSSYKIKDLIRAKIPSKKVRPFLKTTDWIRSSSISNMCPRMEVLRSLNSMDINDDFKVDTMLNFLHGTALHWILQNSILPDISVLIGQWRCTSCGKLYGKHDNDLKLEVSLLVFRPIVCSCGCSVFLYEEIFLKNEEFRITGHPDGFLVFPGKAEVGLFEAKSIHHSKLWEVKNVPMVGHFIQMQAYFLLTGLTWGKLLYWAKGYNGLSAFVEHDVIKDDVAILNLKVLIQSIWDGITSGVLPDRICANDVSPRALRCPMKDNCFASAEKVSTT